MRIGLHNTVVFLILFLAGFGLFAPSLSNNFIYGDDKETIADNALFFHQGLVPTFVHVFKAPSLVRDRPVTVLSLWLNAKALGISAFSFRTVNVFLHVVVAFTLYLCCLYLPLASGAACRPAAILTALLFLAHPFNIFPVNCLILQRSQILASLFGLWALLALFKYAQEDQKKWLFLILLFLLLSILSKPTGITFILILPVFAWFLKIKLPKYYALGLLALIPVFIILTQALVSMHHQKISMTSPQYWSVSLRAVVFYIRMFFWPFDLRPYFCFDLRPQILGLSTCLAFIFHVSVLSYTLLILRKKSLSLCLSVLGAYLAFLPESVHPLTQVIVQYRTYCPYIFLCFFVYVLLSAWWESKIVLSVFIIFLLFCASVAFCRITALKTLADLGKERVLADASNDYYNFNTIGLYSFQGQPQDAIRLAQYLKEKRPDQKIYGTLQILAEGSQRPLNPVEKEKIIDDFQGYAGQEASLPSLLMLADQLIKNSLIDQKNEFEHDLFFQKIPALLENKKYLNYYKGLYIKIFDRIPPEEKIRFPQAQAALKELEK
jgi:hypothetical protein